MPASVRSQRSQQSVNPNPSSPSSFSSSSSTGIAVFEDPWPSPVPTIQLEDAAQDHIALVGFFLRLLPHFPSGSGGVITDEALAYSEWRYICYLRFLDVHGYSPHDRPPPWDVALVWYSHLMTPSLFHSHLYQSTHRPSLGLNHHHFPITRLLQLKLSGRWSDRQAARDFTSWSSSPSVGYYLPYQLWPSPPWEQPSLFSRIFHFKPKTKPPKKLSKVPIPGVAPYKHSPSNSGCAPIATHIHQPPNPLFPCSLSSSSSSPNSWPLSDYALFRTGQIHRPCQSQHLHDSTPSSPYSSSRPTSASTSTTKPTMTCELAPWPCISHLKTALYRQAAFWNAVHIAHTTQPSFFPPSPSPSTSSSLSEYITFLTLFRRPLHHLHNTSRFDPKASSLPSLPVSTRLIPPTLEIDLLWRTHRLFPGCYFEFCDAKIGQIVDSEPTGEAARLAFDITQAAWSHLAPSEPWPDGGSEILGWQDTYTPDVAVLGPENDPKTPLSCILTGLVPPSVKSRRRQTTTSSRKKPPSSHQRYGAGAPGGRYSFSSTAVSTNVGASPRTSTTTGGGGYGRVSDAGSSTLGGHGTMASSVRGSMEKGVGGGLGEDERNWRISGVVV